MDLDNMNHYYNVRLKEVHLSELEQFENFSFVKGNLVDKVESNVFGATLRRLCSFLLEEQYTVRKLIALLKKRQRQILYLLMVYKRLL